MSNTRNTAVKADSCPALVSKPVLDNVAESSPDGANEALSSILRQFQDLVGMQAKFRAVVDLAKAEPDDDIKTVMAEEASNPLRSTSNL